MLLLFSLVSFLLLVKLLVFCSYFLFDLGCVSDSEVVIGTLRDFLTKILESLGRGSKLTDHIDLEVFSLLLHMLKED